MTNEQYRQSRGTTAPFTLTAEQAREAWQQMNKATITARRVREAKHGKRNKFLGDTYVDEE